MISVEEVAAPEAVSVHCKAALDDTVGFQDYPPFEAVGNTANVDLGTLETD